MNPRLSIILLGATGFTGKYCIKDVHRLTKANGRSLTWGIAGRSEAKLKAVLSQYQKDIGEDLSSVPIIVTDINDDESLRRMCSRATVVINCCGPYRFLGEQVVKACIESGTHHVDVTGEPEFMERMQLKYHKAAQEKGVYIVSACGMDSIPVDMGIIFLQKIFKGTLNSVETHLRLTEKHPTLPGPTMNYTTWQSLIYSIANAENLKKMRRQLYKTPLPKFEPKLKSKAPIYREKSTSTWLIPFQGADRSVAQRSQRYLYEHEKVRPAQIQVYMEIESIYSIIKLSFYAMLFKLFINREYGRKLMLRYPELFTGGYVSHKAPLEAKMENCNLKLTFYGEGWDESESGIETDCKRPLNKTLTTFTDANNPSYALTSLCVTLASIVIITETEKLPERGGVYTPGAAFYKTSLLEQLKENGFSFKIKSKM